jgi:hypothetical protein
LVFDGDERMLGDEAMKRWRGWRFAKVMISTEVQFELNLESNQDSNLETKETF